MPRTDVSSLSPVESLVLVRLLVPSAKGTKAADVVKSLAPLTAGRYEGGALASVVDRALIRLGTLGFVEQTPGKTKKAAPTLAMTVEGHQAALAVVRVDALPPKLKPTWANLQKHLLPSRALDLPAAEPSLATDGGLRAVLLDRQAGLRLGGAPKLKEAREAWARKHLNMKPKEKVSVDALIDALLNRELGENGAADPKKALDRLLARGLDAPNATIKEFRGRIIADWVHRDGGGPAAPPTPAAPVLFPSLELAAFARLAREAARRSQTGRYGGNKVFIVHVWRTLQNDPAFRGGDLDAFKRRLTEANNARLLNLARADLVQAMNPEDVSMSETPYMSTCFHFIRDDLEGGGAS